MPKIREQGGFTESTSEVVLTSERVSVENSLAEPSTVVPGPMEQLGDGYIADVAVTDAVGIREVRERIGLAETEHIKVCSLSELRAKAVENGSLLLYHGGLPEHTQLGDIDLNKLGSQQNKPGRTYGGFYLTDDSSLPWSEQYARSRNNVLHGFLIRQGASVQDRGEGVIDRLSQEERDGLVAQGVEVVKGKDVLGRVQYVLLTKECVEDIGHDVLVD